MINYLIEFSFIHLILISAYWILLRNETQYSLLRWYLLGSGLLAVTIPLLDIQLSIAPDWTNQTTLISEPLTQVYWLEPVFIGEAVSTNTAQFPLIWAIYGVVSLGMLLYLAIGLAKIIRITRVSSPTTIHGFVVYTSERVEYSFTFLGKIYINPQLLDSPDCLPIITHEAAHVKLGHGWDLMLCQLFRIAFWWLPTSWIVNKEIKKIHEYQADAFATSQVNRVTYSKILISNTLKAHGLILANSFHDGLILKRINAMKKQSMKIRKWKLGMVGTIALSLTIVFACAPDTDTQQDYSADYPSEVQKSIKELRLKIGDKLVLATPFQRENFFEVMDSLKRVHGEILCPVNPPVKVTGEDGSIKQYTLWVVGMNPQELIRHTAEADENGVYSIVEEPGSYKEGMPAFYEFVGDNIGYPTEARTNRISGRVYVQFVLNEDGSISDVQTVKGIGYGCDEEAERVLRATPTGSWTPGMLGEEPVKQRMVLPIIFKLDDHKTTNEQEKSVGANVKKLEEMVVVGYGNS